MNTPPASSTPPLRLPDHRPDRGPVGGRHDRRRAATTLSVVAAALFADSLLYSAVVPVLPVYAQQNGASTTAIGLLFASYAAALLVATPLVAVVADAVGHRRMLVAGMSAVTAATILFALADSYGALLAARSLQGAAAAAVWTSGVALLADQVDHERQGTAMGLVMAAVSAGLLLGPPVTGALSAELGVRTAFLVLAAAAAACAALQPLVPAATTAAAPRGFRGLGTPRFLTTLLAVALAAGCLALLEPLMPLELHARHGADSRQIGLVFGAATLAHVVVAPLVGALGDRRPRRPLIACGLVAMGLVVPLLTVAGSVAATTLTLAAFAVAYTFVLVPALPEVAAESRAAGRGYAAAYATFNVAFAVGMMTGPAAGAAVASALSTDGALVTTSLLLLGVGVCLRLFDPSSEPELEPHDVSSSTRPARPAAVVGRCVRRPD